MAGFQFIHYETFASISSKTLKKQSINGICAEAERIPHACKHIHEPKQPNIIFGLSVKQACELALIQAEGKKDSIGRKIRADAQILLSGVSSYPIEPNSTEFDNMEYLAWRKKSVDFFYSEWGDQFVSAIEHIDEKFLHIHFYVLPKPDSDKLHIRSICKATAARDAIADHGLGSGKSRATAYKKQMSEFQNRYYDAVSIHFGHGRMGPKRRRLSRKEWKSEQAENDARVIRDREQSRLFFENKNAIKLISDKKTFVLEKEKILTKLLLDIKNEQAIKKSLIEKSLKLTCSNIFYRIRNTNAYLLNEVNQLTDKLKYTNEEFNFISLENKRYKSKFFSCQHELDKAHVKIDQLSYDIQLRNNALDKFKQQMSFIRRCLKAGEYEKIESRENDNERRNK